MILVDTSVWVEHLRQGLAALSTALDECQVLMHPLVLGELACGNLRNRAGLLRLLGDLPAAPTVTDSEALAFIEAHQLMGRGIGYIDVHLLAATALAAPATLWTLDMRLGAVAAELGGAL